MTDSAAADEEWRETAEPEPSRRAEGPARWGPRRTLAVVAIALAVGVAGSLSVTAITSGSASGQLGGPGGGAAFSGSSGGGFGGMGQPGSAGNGDTAGSGAVLSDAMHGEFTVRTEQGSYRTKRLQRGTLTAVGDTEITVRSGDDYLRDYTVNSETVVDSGQTSLDELEQGRSVTVVATLSGDDATAITISGQQSGNGSGNSTGNGGFPGRGGNSGQGGDSGGFGNAPGGGSGSGSDGSGDD
ncbi:hypothetical protein SAMN04487904_109121 [Actinopolyspora lacussalsi subsp. righensis]|uniref:DUF5666 domain-containing protein n=1 Tax=Actinopolyspora righensis TaxID=995060 RepID=A0A1I7B4T9_9ACTN|nr:hypothetical protein [Actinopolyspora righensis]SFT82199.1 hypothetical protein SAMN04487904_109121 [Actinopolyspora righensis]